MAHDPHVKAWIQSINQQRKHLDDAMDPYKKRFPANTANMPKPTQKEIQDVEKLLAQAKQLAAEIYADYQEVYNGPMNHFADRSPFWFDSARDLLKRMKKAQ